MNARQLLKRLLHEYIAPYRKKIALAVVCMVIAAAMTAANAYLMQPMLDEVFVKKNMKALQWIPLAIIGIAVLNAGASFGQTILMRYVGQRVIANMQLDLYAHVIRADLDMVHNHSAGRLISRFTNDIQMMRHSISNVMTGLAKELLTMIFLIGVMIYMSWELALMALVGFPLAIFPIARLGRRMRKLSDGTQHELGELTAQLDESFQGVRIVKAYGAESFEEERARGRVERLFKLYFKAARIQAAASPMMEMIGGVAIAVVVWYGGWQVFEGNTTPGAFFSFITSMLMAYKPVKTIASLNTHLQEGLAAARRYFAMLDTLPRVKDAVDAKALSVSDAKVELDNVSFTYGEDGGGVQGISLTLQPGTTSALVGASGSGKSTLINLILRFYDVSDGAIRIDGQDIREVTQKSLRANMALVSQDVVLFDDTVAANIAYGRPELTREAVIEAAKQADAHEFISAMPEGYDTIIGPHGVRLSGGQRQRLSIARAILRDAPILLLDEATSALDTRSERSVQAALNALMKGRTTLVIAHRLSTIQHADVIYVLDGGQVAEQGSHAELLRREGQYAALNALQFTGDEA